MKLIAKELYFVFLLISVAFIVSYMIKDKVVVPADVLDQVLIVEEEINSLKINLTILKNITDQVSMTNEYNKNLISLLEELILLQKQQIGVSP